MVKKIRRQRRSPSSSVERSFEEPAADPSTSGQRARESPAETPIDSSALVSPIDATIAVNPRAPMSPVDQEQSGLRARESPADDEEDQDEFDPPKSPDHSDGGPAEIPIFSSKRKVGILSEKDPVAGTIDQLREELLQLRQQRDDRDRQIAQLTLLHQNVLEGKAAEAPSTTQSPKISH
jgi:hypothetical protein